MKNICLTIHSLSPKGGEERMCTLLANSLVEWGGYNVIVVCLNMFYDEIPSYDLNKNIKRYTLCGNRIERRIQSFFPRLLFKRYKHILIKHKVDVVIDVDIHQSLVTTKVTKGTNIKVISWDHFNYERFKVRWSHDMMMKCFNSGEIDKLVVLTDSDMQNFIKQEGIPSDFITFINNPSPIENNSYIKHNEKKVISLGRLAHQKGFDLLIAVWEIIEKERSDWELEIVGEGSERFILQEMINEKRLRHITLSPYTSDITNKYKSSSIYALPSRTEGFPLVLIEAETMSLPLVAFNCGGPSAIIKEGYNGFLVEPENTKMLAERLLDLMNNDELREQMSHNAFEDSKKYKMENIIGKWEKLIESL